MFVTPRAIVMFLCAALLGTLTGLALAHPATASAPVAQTVAAQTVVYVPTVQPVTCREEMRCWNSCTMGNHSPCDQTATLPNGSRFRVSATGMDRVHDRMCGRAMHMVHVTVDVVSVAGTVVASADESVCAVAGPDVSLPGVLPDLFAEAGSQV
jgi:hypothetical protein